MYHKIIICSNCENVTHRVLRICTINHHCSAPTFTYFVIDIVFKEFRKFKSLKLFYRKENICQNLQRLPTFVLKCLFHCIPMQRILESCYSGSRDTVTLHCVTQLKLDTGEKLSSTIFCCLSVCLSVRHRCHPTKSPLFPIYTGIQALC